MSNFEINSQKLGSAFYHNDSEALNQTDETDKTDSWRYENEPEINAEKLPEILVRAGE